jgi:hypothetical protein
MIIIGEKDSNKKKKKYNSYLNANSLENIQTSTCCTNDATRYLSMEM